MRPKKKLKRLYYPPYLKRWTKNRRRNYDDRYELQDEFKEKNGFYPNQDYDIHHIDFDRENGSKHNLIIIKKETHQQLHDQLNMIVSALIKTGLIKFSQENPHYYIEDIDLINNLYVVRKFSFEWLDSCARILLRWNY